MASHAASSTLFFLLLLSFVMNHRISCYNLSHDKNSGFTFPVKQHIRAGMRQSRWMHKRVALAQPAPVTNGTSSSHPGLRAQLTTLDEKYGQFFAIMQLGSPPTTVAMTIDTGSEFIWVQCQPCKVCSNQLRDPIFDPRKSSTYKKVSCNSVWCQGETNNTGVAFACSRNKACAYNASYLDGSSSAGIVSQDVVIISNESGQAVTIPNFVFGCGHRNLGMEASLNASGLMGLDRAKYSAPSQFQVQKFSYCLPNRKKNVDATGFITFGEQSLDKPGVAMQYTKLIQNTLKPLDQLYYVQLTGISVGKSAVAIPESEFHMDASSGEGGTIIDSGTVMTRFVGSAYAAFRDAFKKQVIGGVPIQISTENEDAIGIDTCFLGKPDYVPDVTLHFEGSKDLILPTDNVLLYIASDEDVYCLAFGSSPVKLNILGNFQQQNILVEIDLEKSQVGFAKAECSKASALPHSRLYLLLLPFLLFLFVK